MSWENREKLVIRPGEELKVGEIYVPKVQNGGTDDSMSRMVVEAYDAQGNFIGTSDTDASGGGKSSVRIDQTTGEIFYTMPEYKGTDLSDQQGMRFSVLAKPRSVDQLQAAVENNNGGVGTAFESSNSLDRYNKANVIGNHQWSFDDTQFHDPKYAPDQQSVISGVDKATKTPVTGRQTLTFKQVGDKIADLKKKREDGGVEAEVKLDDSYVYEGWDAKMDPETYDVTVTTPENPRPGTFAQPRVIVTYSNGSKDIIPLLAVVDPNNTQVTEVVARGTVEGPAGKVLVSELDLKPVLKGHKVVAPKSYDVDKESVPEGWRVAVDDDGTVKVKAISPEAAANNTKIVPRVIATYPDGTTDVVDVPFQIVNAIKVPDYTAVSGQVSQTVKLKPVLPEIGLGGSADDEKPNRYTFPDGSFEYKLGDWTVTIDEKTGELSSTIPETALPGARLTVPVKAYYATGATPQVVTGTINVIGDGTGKDFASYPAQVTKAGEKVSSDIDTKLPDPKLAKYKLPDNLPKDWKFSVDEKGTVTAIPDATVQNGTTVTVPVEVTYPDGSTATVPAEFTVIDAYARTNDPIYPTVTGRPGDLAVSQVDRTRLHDAAEPRFSIITDPNDPDYIEPPRNLKWEDVKIDPVTGVITTKISKRALPGTSADIPVRVTYKDNSTDKTIATVVVVAEQRQVYEAQYMLQTTTPGGKVTSEITDETKIPEEDLTKDESKRYQVPDDVDGWAVSVDKDGVVTATAPADARPGDGVSVPVTVKYRDGSTDTVYAPFKVKENQKDINEPSYPVESTKPDTEVKRPVTRDGAPDGTTFSFGMDGDKPKTEDTVDGWTYKIDPKTGEVSVTPPAGSKPGDKHVHNVTVTYPDGSTDETPVTTVVNLTQNFEVDPTYPPETTFPGETVTAPLTIDLPNGITVAEKDPYKITPADGYTATDKPNEFGNPTYTVATANGDWLVGLDKKGNVIATAPEGAKPGDSIKVPVTVTYSDGSTDRIYAPINIQDAPTREVPFDVEYKFDDTVPQGTYRVETEGVPGTEVQDRKGNWSQTKAPVNEVVVIGTKPAKATDEMTWKMSTGFDTIMRPNPALKPGEVEVVQEGEAGERTITAKFDATLEPGGVPTVKTTSDTVTKDPKPRIVEYGPRLEDQVLTFTQTNRVPFETEVKYDPNLKAGEQVIEQKGEEGVDTVTTKQKLVDGKPSGEPTVTTERTKEPVAAEIRVGTKTTGETTKTVAADVPFGVKVEFDPNMPAGTSKTVTEGKPGKKTITVTQKVTNSQPDGEATVEEKVTEQPVDQVIKVGTKPSEASEKVTWTAQVPFEVETRPNPELKPGEIKVFQKGVPGEKTYTADFSAKGDQASVTPEEKQTKDPVKEIIEYGPKAEDTSVVTKTEKPVSFETEIVFDDSLEEGEQVVDQQGELGTEVVTSTQKIVDGKPSGEPEVTTERTKEPKKQIIRVGTKTTGKNTEAVETEVPFDVKVVYDPNLKPGESKVTQEGKPGKKKVTIERDIVNSKPGDPKITEEIIEKPVEKVVTVGTKPAEATNKATWTAPLPYDTIVRPNSDLKPGEIKTVQSGEYGEKEFTADFTAKDNTSSVNTTEKVTKQPVQQIIEYGPGADDSEVVTKTEKPVPFATEIVFDDSLKAGEQVVDQQGENGIEVETSTQKIVDGEPSGEPTVTTERTKEPTNAVIRVGTKTEGTYTTESEVAVPFETEIQFDDSLPAGTQETVQEGKPGKDKVTTTQTIENSKVTGTTTETKRVDEPVKKIIKVGTKGDTTSKSVEWTESIPFEVEVRENPDLKAGETKVVQEGKPGEVKHTVTVTSDNGEITTDDSTATVTEPTKHIIEVGTAPTQTELTDKHTEQLPFDTLIEVDPNLEAGKVIEDRAGSFGEKEVTKVWKLEDGKAVGDPETSEKVTKEPTSRKLRIGSKVVTETEKVTETTNTTTTVTEKEQVPAPEIERSFFGAQLVKPGQSESQDAKNHTDGNTYEVPSDVDGWSFSVDENGRVTATAPSTAESGDYIEVPVTVTPENGKPYVTNAVFIVKEEEPIAPEPNDPEIIQAPTYNPDVIKAGDTKTVGINYGHAGGNTYELGEIPDGWTVNIDETTGELTVTPPADTPSGTIKEIPVKVTTKDGDVFNVKTVIGVISDNCGCEPVEPNEPTDEPTEEPEEPTAKPEEPTAKPEEPTAKPEEPTAKPEEPTAKPEEPTAKPEEPTAKPEEPTVKPEEPTVKPEEPTVKPEEPTTVTVTETVDPSNPTPSEEPKDPEPTEEQPTGDASTTTVTVTETKEPSTPSEPTPSDDPKEPELKPTVTVTVTEDPSKPTPTDETTSTEPTTDNPKPSDENPTVTVTVTEDPSKPSPTDDTTPAEPTADETPSEDPTTPVEPTEPTDPTDPDTPVEPSDPTDPNEPSEPDTPADPNEPRIPEVGSLWPILIPLVLVPAVIGHFINQPGAPAPKLPGLPLKPQKPEDVIKDLQPKAPGEAEQPKPQAPVENEQPKPQDPQAPMENDRSNNVESKDVEPSQSDNTSRYTGKSPSTTDSKKSTNSGFLANTGANVLGLLAAGLALIAGAALLLRPSRRRKES
ncbi:G5 domain-containing protein [Corynebacterium sp. FDAARGOS 1242]|uniref:G5 domain-containing protein n=1 Tax=Corynebacterium sp. FDAARGOS 1242 TaxID=2778078 RepID=UPI001952404A|nr:G5 domain-containing protein [Corynebacterium sp. FDAARGOS 1242]QRP99097.1 G5 domain-containing protein [Corynebacterium sp. FDAARGOS 1242]